MQYREGEGWSINGVAIVIGPRGPIMNAPVQSTISGSTKYGDASLAMQKTDSQGRAEFTFRALYAGTYSFGAFATKPAHWKDFFYVHDKADFYIGRQPKEFELNIGTLEKDGDRYTTTVLAVVSGEHSAPIENIGVELYEGSRRVSRKNLATDNDGKAPITLSKLTPGTHEYMGKLVGFGKVKHIRIDVPDVPKEKLHLELKPGTLEKGSDGMMDVTIAAIVSIEETTKLKSGVVVDLREGSEFVRSCATDENGYTMFHAKNLKKGTHVFFGQIQGTSNVVSVSIEVPEQVEKRAEWVDIIRKEISGGYRLNCVIKAEDGSAVEGATVEITADHGGSIRVGNGTEMPTQKTNSLGQIPNDVIVLFLPGEKARSVYFSVLGSPAELGTVVRNTCGNNTAWFKNTTP